MEKGAPQNRRGSPDRSQRAVLAGLPIELWALIVGHCHADDLASLVRVCGALRECAWARVDNTCRATHASVDAFIARWEQKSAACDATLVAMSCSCLRVDVRGYSGDTSDGDDNDSAAESHDDRMSSGGDDKGKRTASTSDDDTERDINNAQNRNSPVDTVPNIRWRVYGTSECCRGSCSPWLCDTWLCDTCGRRALALIDHASGRINDDHDEDDHDDHDHDDDDDDHPSRMDHGDLRHCFHALHEIKLDRRHVWTRQRRYLHLADFVLADPVVGADFVVPTGVAHLLDPLFFQGLARGHASVAPVAYGHDGILAAMGSIRGWMPLRRRLYASTGSCDRHQTALMICCDAANSMWGAVAVARIHRLPVVIAWHCGDRSVGALIARWREHPLRLQDGRFATDWVEWAIHVYTTAMHRISADDAKRTADDHGGAYERIAEQNHAESDKPWAHLLDAEEHRFFFDDQYDAVDSILDDNAGAYETARQRRRRPRRRGVRDARARR